MSRWLPKVVAAAALLSAPASAATLSITVNTPAGSAAQDAVIVLDPQDGAPPLSQNSAVIDQINKRFVPQVTVIRTGTAVTFPNGDHIRHQVYSFSPAKTFTLKLYAGSPKEDVVFDKPGLVVLGCNIHDTMVGFVAVVDSPYFGKVSSSGALTLEVPAGRYKVRLWHPRLAGAQAPKEITIGAAAQTAAFVADLSGPSDSVAPLP